MADNPASSAAAPAEVAEQLENLHLDEATGEKVSKSELKRRQKQRATEEKKKAKADAAPPKAAAATKKNKEEETESNLTPNVSFDVTAACPLLVLLMKDACSNTSKFDPAISTSFVRPRIPYHIRTSFK